MNAYFRSRDIEWLENDLRKYRDNGLINFKNEYVISLPECTVYKKDKLFLTTVALGLIQKNRDFVLMSSEEYEAEWELKQKLKGKDIKMILGPFYPIKMHFLLDGCPLSVVQEEDGIVIRPQGDGTLLMVCEEGISCISEYIIAPTKGSLIYTGKPVVECEEDLIVSYLPPQIKLSPSIALLGEKSYFDNCFEITYQEIQPKITWVKQSEFKKLKDNPLDLVLLKLCFDAFLDNSKNGARAYVNFSDDRENHYTERFSMSYILNLGDDHLSLDKYHFHFENSSLVFYNNYEDEDDHLVSAKIEVELYKDDELVDDLSGALFPEDFWGYDQLFENLEQLKKAAHMAGESLKDEASRFGVLDRLFNESELKK